MYYLRRVLHDYYDDRCRDILCKIARAMGPTSRVVISDYVFPEDGEDLGEDMFPYLLDVLLFLSGGTERTASQWRRLLDSAGLEIVKIWRKADAPIQADIEARLKATS